MADYVAKARSNYFKVKDREAFDQALRDRGLQGALVVTEGREDNEGLIMIYSNEALGEWPDVSDPESEDDDDDYNDDYDIVDFVVPHLAEDSVAIFIQVGSEKLRYVDGWAEAVNASGKRVRVDLNDIYTKAEKLGGQVTRAEY